MLTNRTAFWPALEFATAPLGDAKRATVEDLLEAAVLPDGKAWCLGWAAFLLASAWHKTQFARTGICADPGGLARAMLDGSMTGKSLRQYILGGRGDELAWRHCHKVVPPPGTDGAEEVAALAAQMRDALVAGGWQ